LKNKLVPKTDKELDMNDKLDFDRLQSKLYLAYHQDGILDMVIGLVAIGFSLSMATGEFVALMASWLPMLLYIPIKDAVTRPRFGYVRFTPQSVTVRRLTASAIIGGLVMLIFMAVTFYQRTGQLSAGFKAWMQQYHMAVMGGLAGLVAVGAAIFTGLKRFYVYGILALALPLFGAWLDIDTYLPILTLGLIIAGSGLVMLIAFLRAHPRTEEK
jgi:type IV secretory pathway VirB2 component (pilin)